MPAAGLVLWLGLALAHPAALGQTRKDKPRVPPGVDPGGAVIAIIGDGVDYTRPQLAARLARDGEGEIIGWDLVDNDRRPFHDCRTVMTDSPCPAAFLEWLASNDQAARLVFLRVAADRPQTLVQAIQTVAQMPVRVVLVVTAPPPPAAFLMEAGERFPQLLISGVVEAPKDSSMAPGGSNWLAFAPRSGLTQAQLAVEAAQTAHEAAALARRDPSLDGRGLMQLLGQQQRPAVGPDGARSSSSKSR